MALHLYRRHRSKCKEHPAGSFSSQGEERRKGWKKCFCPIVVSGIFPDGEFRRRSTEEWEWDKAEAQRKAWEESGPPPSSPDSPPEGHQSAESCSEQIQKNGLRPQSGVSISDATKAYLQDHQTFGTALGSLRRYRWLIRRFEEYSAAHGITALYRDSVPGRAEWTTPVVRDFAAYLNHSPSSTQKSISNLHGFFAFCEENKWISDNPAAMRRKRNRATASTKPRWPYEDAELARMYDACLTYQGRKWKGEDLADWMAIAVHTGLRRCDVSGFHISRLKPETGEVHIRTTKYGVMVYTWVPEWLVERIQYRAETIGPYIFGERTTRDPQVLGLTWYTRLKELWASCGPFKEPPNCHRFRHTFVRIMLEAGHSPAFVAELAGDTEATIRKYYSRWVKGRQDFVTNALRGSFVNVPRPQFQNGGRVIAFEKKPRSA